MSEELGPARALADIPKEERREAFNAFFSPEGFFQAFMHSDRGPRELLGFLEQCKDIVRMHFVQKAQGEATTKGLVRPGGVIDRFKKRWQ